MYTSLLKNIKGDKVIWGVVIFLFLFSLLTIYSSTSAISAQDGMPTTTGFLIRQIAFVLVAFGAMYLAHIVPIGWYRRFAVPLLVISILMLLAAILFGTTINGSPRWLPIPGFRRTFQPADIARIAVVLYVAKTMESYDLSSFRDFAKKLLLPVGIVFILIMWSSTSTALILAIILFALFFVGGIKTGHLLKVAAAVVLLLAFVVLIGKTTSWFPRIETAVHRMETFWSKENEGDKSSKFQSEQSMIAVAKGGWGQGPGNSTQRFVLPHPYSDFVYAIIIEEYGIAGGVIILLLYLILLFRAIVIARSCTRVFPMIVVLGLVFLITFQAIINMGVAVGIFPVTGQPLPLLSQGGSSLVSLAIALGIVLAVSRATEERSMNPVPATTN